MFFCRPNHPGPGTGQLATHISPHTTKTETDNMRTPAPDGKAAFGRAEDRARHIVPRLVPLPQVRQALDAQPDHDGGWAGGLGVAGWKVEVKARGLLCRGVRADVDVMALLGCEIKRMLMLLLLFCAPRPTSGRQPCQQGTNHHDTRAGNSIQRSHQTPFYTPLSKIPQQRQISRVRPAAGQGGVWWLIMA